MDCALCGMLSGYVDIVHLGGYESAFRFLVKQGLLYKWLHKVERNTLLFLLLFLGGDWYPCPLVFVLLIDNRKKNLLNKLKCLAYEYYEPMST